MDIVTMESLLAMIMDIELAWKLYISYIPKVYDNLFIVCLKFIIVILAYPSDMLWFKREADEFRANQCAQRFMS